MTRYHVAPWPTSLRLTSGVGTLATLAIAWFAAQAAPHQPGFTRTFGLAMPALVLLALCASLLTQVCSYTVEGTTLHVERPFWRTTLDLGTLQHAWVDHGLCGRSRRVYGNAGMFAFTGLFESPDLGRYRLYATDPGGLLVLRTASATFAISPQAPEAVLQDLRRHFPQATFGRPDAPL